jgi:hypothetical protein
MYNAASTQSAGCAAAWRFSALRRALYLLAAALLICSAVGMQGAFAQETPQQSQGKDAKDMEPAVDTSATPPPSAMEPAVDTSKPPPPSVLNPSVDTSAAGEEAPATGQQPAAAGDKKGRTTSRSGKAMDRLELDTTQITGNRELPKVLYIVPWKRSDLGDLLGKPVNSLLDEVLTPVDRDVFKRENRYFTALDSNNAPAAEQTPPDK